MTGQTFEAFQKERHTAATSAPPKVELTTVEKIKDYEDHLFSAQYDEYEYLVDEEDISNHETLNIIDVEISKNLVNPEGDAD